VWYVATRHAPVDRFHGCEPM